MQIEELARTYKEPPRAFSPAPAWWWSGDELNRERLRWQMERMAEGGVYNLVVINLAPSGPLYGSDPDRPRFLSEAWWEMFSSACEDAHELGVKLWFYDQIGFSGANLQGELVRLRPEFAGHSLESVVVEGEGPLKAVCPPEGVPLAASIAPVDEEGRPLGAPEAVPLDARSARAWRPGRNRLRLIYSVRKGFDYLSIEACAGLLDKMHGAIERRLGRWFGNVIAGSFQDELPSMPLWSADFARRFRIHKGYDLLPRLTDLWEGESEEALRLRADYQDVRADLAEESFFRPFFDWHEQRELLCGFDQQGEARAGKVTSAVEYYADYMRTHRWYGAPGCDHYGDGKIHSSMAHLNGRQRVWIEAFHTSGWGGTLEETFDWLLPWIRAGANLYNPHAFYYSTRGGWYEWAPPSTCWRQPYWRHYPVFANAVSRLCYLMTCGDHVCDVAVLYPTTTVQAHLTLSGPLGQAEKAKDAYWELTGRMIWMDPRPGVFDRDARDFEVLSDESLTEAEISEGGLRIRSEAYRAIILPECSELRHETAETLCRFAEAGGLLVAVGSIPRPLGGPADEALGARLAALFASGRAIRVNGANEVPAALSVIPKRVEAPVPTLHRRAGDHDMLFVPAADPGATFQDGTLWFDVKYDFSPDRYIRPMKIRLHDADPSSVQLWDPLSGERRELAVRVLDSGVETEIPFDSGPAAVIVWRRGRMEAARAAGSGKPDNTAAAEAEKIPGRAIALPSLEGSWESEIVQTMDNRYGDFDKPDYEGAPPAATWFMGHRVERPEEDGLLVQWQRPDSAAEGWERVQATFGRFAWWKGPFEGGLDEPPTAGAGTRTDPAAVGWKPAVYSLSRGIPKDLLHKETFGPKAHVPEEFLDFGKVKAGQAVDVRTCIRSDGESNLCLAIGAPAAKRAWLNGRPVDLPSEGYQSVAPVRLDNGLNVLDFRLVAEEDTVLRAYWAFVRHPDRFVRPEWFKTPVDAVKDSVISFSRTVDIPFQPSAGTVQIGANAACRVLVNGEEIGRQGGFEPYYSRGRVQPYETALFKRGANTVVVELTDPGVPAELMVDSKVAGPDGSAFCFFSDAEWRMQRAGGPLQPVEFRRGTSGFMMNQDPPFNHLWRRPHPLPHTAWLDETESGNTVADVVPDASFGRDRIEWFRWTLPPGAVRLKMAGPDSARLWVDGAEIPLSYGSAELPSPGAQGRTGVLRVAARGGRTGGAVFDGPVTYEIGKGSMTCGDWSGQGLESHSGGVLYRKTFVWEGPSEGSVLLDLGAVRGTAEVRMNGQPAGIRIWSPYRVDVGGLLKSGENTLDILVMNTLAPYLNSVSPTHYVFEGHTVSGLLGPVRFVAGEEV